MCLLHKQVRIVIEQVRAVYKTSDRYRDRYRDRQSDIKLLNTCAPLSSLFTCYTKVKWGRASAIYLASRLTSTPHC